MTNCNKENLNLIHNELNTHNQIIKGYIELKQAGQKIRQITKHALEIVDNTNIKKILTKYTEQFIIYVKEVLDIGIQNIGKDELISKFQIINDNTFFYASSLIGKQNLIAWNEYISKFINNYKNDIIQIFSDPVNDKNSRFLIKSLDFVHTIIKQFVLYFSEYYSNNN